ncbi:hypothetical protein AOQ84DRAFT_40631 [Glonium stellatum]|uniref:BTB domain-containing protein n=1 Tax=Glonium stellatum TaxID=574774 RepID=A0A8E2F165_9PEZI|nr:hypothetical protein AOQ84DRAFT_40631 [Glonium stellatum]
MATRTLRSLAVAFGRGLKVHVGKTPDIFYVHEDLICSSSEFFRNAINGGWRKSDDRVIQLANDPPDAFGLYIQWLYTKRIPSGDFENTKSLIEQEYAQLGVAYVLGEKLQDLAFKNAIIDALIEVTDILMVSGKPCFPRPDTVRYIYEGTPGPCGVRRLLVDFFMYHGDREWAISLRLNYPKAFLQDLAMSLFLRQTDSCGALESITLSDKCIYH